jgi:hypothetical protein
MVSTVLVLVSSFVRSYTLCLSIFTLVPFYIFTLLYNYSIYPITY